jgi:PAS domain S-box-containing protein
MTSRAEEHSVDLPKEHSPGATGLRLRGWRLGSYFLLLVGLFVAAAAAATIFVHVQTERDDRRAAEDDARFAADTAARQLGDQVRLIQATVAQLASNPGVTRSFTEAEECSLTFGGLGGQDGSHLDIVRANGTVTCSSRAKNGDEPVRYAGADWARSALAGPTFLAPAVDPGTGAHVAIVTAPIPGAAGFVAAFVDLAAIGPALGALYGGANEREFLVVGGDGRTVVARSIDPGRWVGTSIQGTPFEDDKGTERRDLDGTSRLYAESSIEGLGWTLLVGEDKEAALAAGDRLERRQLAVILAGLGAVLLAAWLLYRYLVVPMGRLSDSVRAMKATGMPVATEISGPAELRGLGEDVGELVTAVNRELVERQRAEAEGRAVLDAALDAVVMIDERGRILEFNRAAEAMFGHERADLLGSQMAEVLVPPSLRAEHYRGLEHYLETGEGKVIGRRVELTALRANGNEFPVELAISRVPGDGPAVFTGFIRDLTEQKRSERELSAYAEQLRGLIESAPDGILMVDAEGRIELVNRQAEVMFGYSAEELLGHTVELLVPEPLRGRHVQHRSGFLAHPRLRPMGAELDLRARRKDGTEFPVEIRLAPVSANGETHVLSLISDVTNLRESEEKLRIYSERLTTLSEIQHAILTARSVDEIAGAAVTRLREALGVARTTVTLIDPEADEYVIFAFDSDEDVGRDVRGLRGPARLLGDRESLLRGEIHLTDLADIADPPSVRALQAAGLRYAASIPLVADGELLGTINLFRREPQTQFPLDLLEIAREVADELALALNQGRLRERLARHAEELEERVAARTAQLEAANSELEAFSYSVSHDLRAPLRAIDGFSRILEEEHGRALPDEGLRYLRLVSENAQNLGRLIDGLLDFSRLGRQAISRQPVDLERLAREVISDLTPEREARSVDITVESLPTVVCDRLLMKQVFTNLLSNALKFTRETETARIEIGSRVENGEQIVFVRDNGVGFDMRHANKLFGVFQRLHRAEEYEGTGLGLALVSRIVVQHGGRIWAEGEPGEGACFYFTLHAKEPM